MAQCPHHTPPWPHTLSSFTFILWPAVCELTWNAHRGDGAEYSWPRVNSEGLVAEKVVEALTGHVARLWSRSTVSMALRLVEELGWGLGLGLRWSPD